MDFASYPQLYKLLDKDHNIHITIAQARQLILDFLLHNYNNYVDFYSYQMNACQPLVSMSDALLSEMVQFFDDGLFNRNVVDLLVQIAADALNLNIFIFQNNSGEIELLNYRSSYFGKRVYMKYTHDNRYAVGNHYEPLIKVKKLRRTSPWPSSLIKSNGTNTIRGFP